MLVTPDIKFHLFTMLSLIKSIGTFEKKETTYQATLTRNPSEEAVHSAR